MIKQIIVSSLVLLFLAVAGCSAAAGSPRAVVSPLSYDFGDIGPDPVTTTFTVSNDGTGPLLIESVTTSCGCTTAQIGTETIAPGEQADLTVTFDPQAHAGAVGQFVRFVYLRTNDPAQPEIEVQIKANVINNPPVKEASQ